MDTLGTFLPTFRWLPDQGTQVRERGEVDVRGGYHIAKIERILEELGTY